MKKTAIYLSLAVFMVILFAASSFADTLVGSNPVLYGWQSIWAVNDDGQNRSVDAIKTTGHPYFDNKSYDPGLNTDGTQMNVGWYITKSGNNFSGGSGPGLIPFWGAAYNSGPDTGGGFDPNFFFQKTNVGYGAEVKVEITGFATANPFGWFETDSLGSTVGTTHQLFSGLQGVSDTATFTPTDYYGFYLTDERGTFYTLSGKDSVNADLTDYFQHFAAFQGDVNTNTYWIAVEDLLNNNHTEDKDYNDFVVKVTSTPAVPEPATMLLLGSGLIGLAGFARRKFRK